MVGTIRAPQKETGHQLERGYILESMYPLVFTGAPDKNRTCGLQLRRLSLYPTELRARGFESVLLDGHGGGCQVPALPKRRLTAFSREIHTQKFWGLPLMFVETFHGRACRSVARRREDRSGRFDTVKSLGWERKEAWRERGDVPGKIPPLRFFVFIRQT